MTAKPTMRNIDPRVLGDAACKGENPNLWFPEKGDRDSERVAKAICQTCPVREACLDYALRNNELEGIWGGRSARRRRTLRREMRIRGELPNRIYKSLPIEHGTEQGWRRCRREEGGACQPCKSAHAVTTQFARPSRAKGSAA